MSLEGMEFWVTKNSNYILLCNKIYVLLSAPVCHCSSLKPNKQAQDETKMKENCLQHGISWVSQVFPQLVK